MARDPDAFGLTDPDVADLDELRVLLARARLRAARARRFYSLD